MRMRGGMECAGCDCGLLDEAEKAMWLGGFEGPHRGTVVENGSPYMMVAGAGDDEQS
jgi:hypothetical protein